MKISLLNHEKLNHETFDGNQTTDSRTTSNGAFNLVAATVRNAIYLSYDSMLTMYTNRTVTSGKVRLRIRESTDFSGSRYQTPKGTENRNMITGYAVNI